MIWYYNDVPLTEEMAEGFAGFVYEIRQLSTGKRYFGRKLFTKAKTLPALKGKVRKRRSRVKSDWETYWGSCLELLDEIEKVGTSDFTRRVIRLCKTKSECSYFEAKAQFENDVLLHPDKFWNKNIMAKIHASHLKHVR